MLGEFFDGICGRSPCRCSGFILPHLPVVAQPESDDVVWPKNSVSRGDVKVLPLQNLDNVFTYRMLGDRSVCSAYMPECSTEVSFTSSVDENNSGGSICLLCLHALGGSTKISFTHALTKTIASYRYVLACILFLILSQAPLQVDQ